jgi:hypothetical protein
MDVTARAGRVSVLVENRQVCVCEDVLEVCFTLRNSTSDDWYDQKTRLATTAGTWAQDVNQTRACCHEKTTMDSTRLGGFGARAGPTQVGGMQRGESCSL